MLSGNNTDDKKDKKRNSDKISVIRLVVWCVVTAIVLVVVNLKEAIYTDQCTAPLKYQANNINLKTAIDKLQLPVEGKQDVNSQAIRIISTAVEDLVGQSVRLCELFNEGRIASEVYDERQNSLSKQFERLLALQQLMPAAGVSTQQLPQYREAVKQSK